MAHQFYKENQRAWFHDEGHPAGFFHTYDGLKVGGESEPARKVHVFLPRDYETVEDRYPVLYMNDGDTAFFPGGILGKHWHTAETLGELYVRQAIRKLIVVAVYTDDRDREYTHEAIPKRQGGGVEEYASYLANALKPFINRHYRTQPEARETTILGSSHGGLAAFYVATHQPDSFGNAAAMSPSFWVGLDTGIGMFVPLSKSRLLQLTSSKLSDRNIRPRIWLDWGLYRDKEFHNWFIEGNATKRGREMAEILQKKFGYVRDVDLFIYEDPKGDHTEDAWAKRLPLVLEAFYGIS